MLNDTDRIGLDQFLRSVGSALRADRSVRDGEAILAAGAMLGRWRVEAFLGRGGSGEVYRVVHSVTRTPAAAKVLTKDDPTAVKRFSGEIAFLKEWHETVGTAVPSRPQPFPCYYESGVFDGRPFFIMELLEPIDAPTDEKGIADYLTDVCSCVRALHLSGIVHRDLKPKNIMRRSSGEVVLIDFGLAKNTFVTARSRTDVSIVSGKAVGVGTPEYAAPEQLTGGEISPAADIHALGRIANAAFGGKPPRSWETIIRRATSSIPAQRYETVDDFATAIRRRNRLSRSIWSGILLMLLAATSLGYWSAVGEEKSAWCQIAKNLQTNGHAVTVLQLGNERREFSKPIRLEADREYRVVGPGILDANLVATKASTTVRLENCVLLNRSAIPFRSAGIRYVMSGCVYLNFTAQDRPSDFSPRDFEGFDVTDTIRFKGPETLEELRALRQKENLEYFDKRSGVKCETKNLHFPRHILCSKHEYTVENMKTKDMTADDKSSGFAYHLDPDRIRTDAEVATFAEVFQITVDEARRILKASGRKCQS